MKKLYYIVFLLVLIFITKFVMTKSQTSDDIKFCNDHKEFTGAQSEFCFQNTEVVRVLEEGYKLGHQMCQNSFKDSTKGTRWNCTHIVDPKRRNMFFGVPHAREGSKEHSIMVSFTAAGMVYHLIKKCQNDSLSTCRRNDLYNCQSFDKTCGQQIDMTVPFRLIRTFFLVSSAGSYQLELNQHNREIGLQTVRKLLRTKMRYGRSDEKTIIDKLLKQLKRIYEHRAKKLRKRNLLRGRTHVLLLPLRSKLVFLLKSDRFSYCHKSSNWYWNGIGRRPCKVETRDSFALENCINMCCDYGYVNIPKQKTVCSKTKPVKCRVEMVNSYYCKYRREAIRKQYDIPFTDFI